MGGCVSSESGSTTRRREPCANLVSLAGEIHQYPVPVTVSEVLLSEASSPDSFFVCDSDRLDFDDFIPSLDLEEVLEPAQIYFLLPVSELKRRLSASDMAALAVKASVALDASSRQRNRKVRISPILAKEELDQSSEARTPDRSIKISSGLRRVKLAAKSVKVSLSSIAEGSELLH